MKSNENKQNMSEPCDRSLSQSLVSLSTFYFLQILTLLWGTKILVRKTCDKNFCIFS